MKFLTFTGNMEKVQLEVLPLTPPPPWRRFGLNSQDTRGSGFQIEPMEVEMVNAALILRKPLLVTGHPGVGKSTLAYAVARELNLGEVLVWAITSQSNLEQGMYSYDAIGRLQEEARTAEAVRQGIQKSDQTRIADFMRLGPLATAFLGIEKTAASGDSIILPRVLLIDEIDKSDLDLPNDLLHVLDQGSFEIRELARLPNADEVVNVRTADSGKPVSNPIVRGIVPVREFPLVILTSNGEREFPPAFLRRCLRLRIEEPDSEKLRRIVAERLKLPYSLDEQDKVLFSDGPTEVKMSKLIDAFLEVRDSGADTIIATDQLLNAASLVLNGLLRDGDEDLRDLLFEPLNL